MCSHQIIALFLQVVYVCSHVPLPQPYFTSASEDIELVENSTAWLPCNVDNLGDSVIRWWRGEILLADSNDYSHPRPARMRVWLNNTLEISNVQREDTSEYVCQIVRKAPWSALHLVHHLTVFYQPEVFPEPKEGEVNVKLGQTVEIACLAKGAPIPMVTWRAQDKDITNSQEKNHVLILKAVSPKMTRKYTCKADNGVGQPATFDFNVKVLYRPIVVADISWLHAAPGLHAELVCRVSSEPEARVEWFFGGEIVEAGSSSRIAPFVKGQQHILQFQNITADDFGIYRCRATNSEGVSEATVELSGRARPAVFKRDVDSQGNDSVLLIWEVDTYSPIIDFTLKFRQVPAPDDQEWISIIVPADGMSPGPIHSKSYLLSGLEKASTYEAVVLSRNRYGMSAPSAPFLFATEGAEHSINGSSEDSDDSESKEENITWDQAAIEENSVQGQVSYSKAPPIIFVPTLIVYEVIIIMTCV